MVNVLFLASTYTLGGAEKAVSVLVDKLDREKFHPIVATLRDKGTVGDMMSAQGVSVATGLTRTTYDFLAVFRIARLMRASDIQVLYLLDHRNAIFFGLLAAWLARVKVRLIAVHTTGMWGGRRSLDSRERILWPLVTRFIALAQSHKQYLADKEGLPHEKVEVIGNGIDVSAVQRMTPVERQELGIPRDTFVVGNVAILRPEKGHENLVLAAQKTLERGYDVYFIVVGGGPQQASLERMVKALGIEDRFRILGFKHDAVRYINLFDIAVISSYPTVETFPLFALEAMALGKPVLSTNVGSLADIVEDGRTGILIPPGDVERLAEGIARFYQDRKLVGEMGAAARRKAELEFRAERTVAKTEALIVRSLGRS